MKHFARALAGVCLLGGVVPGSAATLIPVPQVPGSNGTAVFGINDSNTIVGGYYDGQNVEHGFFGSLDGAYTSFDYHAGAFFTEGRGISNDGHIAGWAEPSDGSCDGVCEFVRNPDGSIVTVTKGSGPLAEGDVLQGILDSGAIAGDYYNTQLPGGYIAFVGKNGKWKQDLTPFGSADTFARGINKAGMIVGFYADSQGHEHGFILQNGVASQIDYPDNRVSDTYLEGINDKGLIVGNWDNSRGRTFAFELDTGTGTFKQIKVTGARFTRAFGVNSAGLVAVSSDAGNFVYCPKKPAKCPSGGVELAGGPSIHLPAESFPHVTAASRKPAAQRRRAFRQTPHGYDRQIRP